MPNPLSSMQGRRRLSVRYHPNQAAEVVVEPSPVVSAVVPEFVTEPGDSYMDNHGVEQPFEPGTPVYSIPDEPVVVEEPVVDEPEPAPTVEWNPLMTKDDLLEIAKVLGLDVTAADRKAEIIAALTIAAPRS